jgi:DNA-binding response OmpR family regulator
LERTFISLSKDLSLDPATFWNSRKIATQSNTVHSITIDQAMLSVVFQGRSCFLGNTLPFKFVGCLASRPNIYVPYQHLLSDIWNGGLRSDAAIRSVVKTLKNKLRQANMGKLADSIDGSVPRHYALKLKE